MSRALFVILSRGYFVSGYGAKPIHADHPGIRERGTPLGLCYIQLSPGINEIWANYAFPSWNS
jgi:hypothetical protein